MPGPQTQHKGTVYGDCFLLLLSWYLSPVLSPWLCICWAQFADRLSLQTATLSLQTGRFKSPVCRLYATQAWFTNRNPVCKLDKSSFRGLVCKWEIIGNELLAQTASRRSASATHAATRAARTAATTTELQAASFGQPGW